MADQEGVVPSSPRATPIQPGKVVEGWTSRAKVDKDSVTRVRRKTYGDWEYNCRRIPPAGLSLPSLAPINDTRQWLFDTGLD